MFFLSRLENNFNTQANLFTVLVHLGLFIFMIFSIQWKMQVPYYAEVELWDTVPTQTKPAPIVKKPEPKKIKKPAPPPEIKKEPIKADRDAEIQLRKKKEAEQKKKKAAELKKQKEIEALQKKLQEQEKLEQLQKQLLEQEKLKQVQEKLQEQEKLEQLQKQLLEQEKIAQIQKELREKDLSEKPRVALESDQDILGGTDSSELAKYKTLIQQKIHQNVNRQLCGLEPDTTLVFKISLMPTGYLLTDSKMVQSSNLPSCDEAVERAILQSQPLPLPSDSRLFSKLKDLELKFQPNAIQ